MGNRFNSPRGLNFGPDTEFSMFSNAGVETVSSLRLGASR